MENSSKKGQITVFIIIGLVLLITVGLGAYFFKQASQVGEEELIETFELAAGAAPIRVYVEDRLKDIIAPAIYLMGARGGYIEVPQHALITENGAVAHWVVYEKENAPTRQEMEEQLSKLIDYALPSQLNFSVFVGENITVGEVSTETIITRDKIIFKIYYPITRHTNQGEIEVSDFSYEAPIRLGYIYDVAKEIAAHAAEDPDNIDLTYLTDLDLEVTIMPYDEYSTIYSITDEFSKIEDVEFSLLLATKFEINSAPKLEFIPDFLLEEGIEFNYTVVADDSDKDELTFSDDSSLFDIDGLTGLISFTPHTTGNFRVTLTVSDEEGKSDSEEILFTIKDE